MQATTTEYSEEAGNVKRKDLDFELVHRNETAGGVGPMARGRTGWASPRGVSVRAG